MTLFMHVGMNINGVASAGSRQEPPATASAGACDLQAVQEQGGGKTSLQSGCWLPVHRPV